MIKPILQAVLLVALSGVLFGCGGGGGSVAETGSGASMTLGPVETRASGGVQGPVTMQGPSSSIMGMFGANFTSAAVNLVPENQLNEESLLNSTMIAYSVTNRPYLFDLSSFQTYTLGTSPAVYANDCHPTWNGTGDYVADSEYDVATSSMQIFVYTSDGLSRTRLTSGSYAQTPSFSPVSSKIAFSKDREIYVISQSGSGLTNLTNTSDTETEPRWSPDGTKVYYLKYVSGLYQLWVMNADGTGQAVVLAPSTSIKAYDVDRATSRIAYVYYNGSNTILAVRGADGTVNTVLSSATDIRSICWSPQGSHISMLHLVGDGTANLETVRVSDKSITTYKTQLEPVVTGSTSWSPLPRKRYYIGTGGLFGSNAAGFLYSMSGRTFKSFLAFDALTRSEVDIDVPPPSSVTPSNHFATITAADSLTMLRYVNGFMTPRITVVDPAAASTRCQGVVVAWDQSTGLVSGVAPFSRSRSGGKPVAKESGGRVTFDGEFLAVYDGKGNKTSGPASGLTLEPESGRLSAR